ncbi:hypothetical protein BJV78DRAFT_1283100 [Lactifluus subvellereus]|nr:hypothetical protein BJV78DRAFT_1283100 [Lactifluus subvellereus]
MSTLMRGTPFCPAPGPQYGSPGARASWDILRATNSGMTFGCSRTELAWKYVQVPNDKTSPAGRGWFPSASWEDGEETKAKVTLLLSSNDRSDELWLLEID